LSTPVPAHLRPIAFATSEVMLDLIYLLQSFTKVDLESMHILLCVTDATMRPFMLDPDAATAAMTAQRPANAIRGAISRRSIADKTGLPRETVRRKTAELAASGLLQIDEEDRVRSAQDMANPEFQRVLEAAHAAMLKYGQRMEQFGVGMR
jgi:hypothetical protein